MTGPLQLDGNKLLFHLDAFEAFMNGEEFFPPYVSVALAQGCNQDCFFCAYQHRTESQKLFPRAGFQRLLAEWKGTTTRAVFFSGDGEPLLNPECAPMAEDAKNAGIAVALNTNGSLLSKHSVDSLVHNLSWIRLSINAGSPKTYAKVHGTGDTQFEKTMKNLEELCSFRTKVNSPLSVGVQCLLLSENMSEIYGLAQRVKNSGANYFTVKGRLGGPSESNLNLSQDLVRRLEELNDPQFKCLLRNSVVLQRRSYKHCYGHRFIAELDAQGNLYGCGPWLGDERFLYGNALETSFRAVWSSERRKTVTQWLEKDLDLSKCMEGCRCDSLNRLLWDFLNPPDHVNFI